MAVMSRRRFFSLGLLILLAATGLSAWVFDEPISGLQLVGVLVLLAGLLALKVPERERPVTSAQ